MLRGACFWRQAFYLSFFFALDAPPLSAILLLWAKLLLSGREKRGSILSLSWVVIVCCATVLVRSSSIACARPVMPITRPACPPAWSFIVGSTASVTWNCSVLRATRESNASAVFNSGSRSTLSRNISPPDLHQAYQCHLGSDCLVVQCAAVVSTCQLHCCCPTPACGLHC